MEIPAVYEFDYGDNSRLPQCRVLSYFQDLSNDGIPDYATVWLGNTVDYDESTNATNSDATADTDDGLIIDTTLESDSITVAMGLNSNTPLTCYYALGIDWDDNGSLDSTYVGETPLDGAVTVSEEVPVPTDFLNGDINVRILVSEEEVGAGNLTGDLIAMGEVEDYRVHLATPEDCTNGIDDDGDGLTDCDDPDCSGNGACFETGTGTGGEGGLESNNRLSGKIAKVQFLRSKTGKVDYDNKEELTVLRKPATYGTKVSHAARGEVSSSIEQFIPIDILEGTETLISSPNHLADVTNANEVFSVDIFDGNTRVGAILALTSENGVYEHTKYVCDRLNGSTIEDILTYRIDGEHDFQIAKLRLPNGNQEFATSFSVREENDAFIVESFWNLEFYTKEASFHNFQIWANNTQRLSELVLETLRLLEVQRSISTYDFGEAPQVFVNGASVTRGELTMQITNRNGSSVVEASGQISESETQEPRDFREILSLSGDEYQSVSMQVGSVYDLGLTLHDQQNGAPDVIFLADGAWGTDYNEEEEDVHQFDIVPGYGSQEEGYLLERNINVAGNVKSSVAIFRAFNPSFRSTDLSDYSMLSFEAAGQGVVEVTLVKSSIREWGDQPRTTIDLPENTSRFNIAIDRFGDQAWDDLTMVVFDVRGNGERAPFEMAISNVGFRNEVITSTGSEITSRSHAVYPNPVVDALNITLTATRSGGYSLRIFDQEGKIAKLLRGNVAAGENTIRVTDLPKEGGFYLYQLSTDEGTIFDGKFLKR